MVRAKYLTPEHLIRAMKQADFYASSGIVLEDVHFDGDSKTLNVVIQPEPNAQYTTQFIATLKPSLSGDVPASDQIGITVATVSGATASYKMTGNELYVRAMVTSNLPVVDPSLPEQKQQAWTQPVGWQQHQSKQ